MQTEIENKAVNEELDPLKLLKKAVAALDDKKARDITVLHTHDVTVLSDYFVIATATSAPHIKTLADEVEIRLRETGNPPLHIEGYRSGGWVLVDFGCIVVHLFTQELREFYNLERLWADSPMLSAEELLK
ncbi:MAG: ribosome silencing factor [Oscillospiraceae bacterium]|jgi:ribosome-associated protein|nr:ribosome silencing factor [Oscillospiraceae bacterium]